MDSNTSSYIVNHTSSFHPVLYFHQPKDEQSDGIIDLGLSLRALQPEAFHPSSQDDYGELIDWQELNPELKCSKMGYTTKEREMQDWDVESQQSWAYVKVNMDGVIVGRKICIFKHMGYSTLALQLEDMFGRQTATGLGLFQAGSDYCLLYKDKHDNWTSVRDVPWKEFVDRVKRLRIVRNNQAVQLPSSEFA